MLPSFRELLVWKKVDKLAHKVFDISETFPGEYVFDLTNSLRRSALSIPENIAEGWACFRPKESLEYLNTSRRSLIQTQYLLLFACKRHLIKEEEFNEFQEGYEEANKMLNGLVKSIRNKPYMLRSKNKPQP